MTELLFQSDSNQVNASKSMHSNEIPKVNSPKWMAPSECTQESPAEHRTKCIQLNAPNRMQPTEWTQLNTPTWIHPTKYTQLNITKIRQPNECKQVNKSSCMQLNECNQLNTIYKTIKEPTFAIFCTNLCFFFIFI
jgi:hypothetical protein